MAENSSELLMQALGCFSQGIALLAAAGMPEIAGTTANEPLSFDLKGALHRLSIGETKFREEMAAGKIPQPYKLGGVNHWDRKDLDSYVRNEKLSQHREAEHVQRLRKSKR